MRGIEGVHKECPTGIVEKSARKDHAKDWIAEWQHKSGGLGENSTDWQHTNKPHKGSRQHCQFGLGAIYARVQPHLPRMEAPTLFAGAPIDKSLFQD